MKVKHNYVFSGKNIYIFLLRIFTWVIKNSIKIISLYTFVLGSVLIWDTGEFPQE